MLLSMFLTSVRFVLFLSCGTSLRLSPHASPSGHGWFDGARRAPSRTIQLRSPGLNALSLRRYQTARILHASLHRWLD